MSNKPFNLEKALAGEPLQCKRTKHKFYFLGDTSKFGSELYYPIVLYNKTLDETTNVAKEHFNDEYYTMWEEPRPRVTLTLPCPLKEPQEDMWFITESGEAIKSNYRYDYADALNLEGFASGLYFATKEDAQEWIYAMRNARR